MNFYFSHQALNFSLIFSVFFLPQGTLCRCARSLMCALDLFCASNNQRFTGNEPSDK